MYIYIHPIESSANLPFIYNWAFSSPFDDGGNGPTTLPAPVHCIRPTRDVPRSPRSRRAGVRRRLRPRRRPKTRRGAWRGPRDCGSLATGIPMGIAMGIRWNSKMIKPINGLTIGCNPMNFFGRKMTGNSDQNMADGFWMGFYKQGSRLMMASLVATEAWICGSQNTVGIHRSNDRWSSELMEVVEKSWGLSRLDSHPPLFSLKVMFVVPRCWMIRLVLAIFWLNDLTNSRKLRNILVGYLPNVLCLPVE